MFFLVFEYIRCKAIFVESHCSCNKTAKNQSFRGLNGILQLTANPCNRRQEKRVSGLLAFIHFRMSGVYLITLTELALFSSFSLANIIGITFCGTVYCDVLGQFNLKSSQFISLLNSILIKSQAKGQPYSIIRSCTLPSIE